MRLAVSSMVMSGTARIPTAPTNCLAKVRNTLEVTKGFIGTSGTLNMSPTDHMGLDLSSFRMLEVKNGDWTLVQ